MFRNTHFFKVLREEILHQLINYPLIRICFAGCSTGKEAYSIAILLKEIQLYHKFLIQRLIQEKTRFDVLIPIHVNFFWFSNFQGLR
ncbi:hypothetical protein PQ459_14025 [Chryseobacterium sp. KACC 21268]|nr:hypothetical protein PQ459_14025 [Chryseobacterium sp. KACC 21268]